MRRGGLGLAAALLCGCPPTPEQPPEPEGPGACDEVECGAHATCDELVGLCACDPGYQGDPATACAPHEDLCAEAAALVGHSACRHAVEDAATWTELSVGSAARKGVRRVGKYLAPLGPAAPLPTVFNDANWYGLHLCLLKEAFAPRFPGFNGAKYQELVYFRATRAMIAGSLYELDDPDPPARYGFTIEVPDGPSEIFTEEELYTVYAALAPRFGAGELGFVPRSAAQQSRVLGIADPKIPLILNGAGGEGEVDYEAYSRGTTYGRVRLYPKGAPLTGFGWQDILILEEVPADLVGVMAGVVTGGRQDVLSHVNVLAARRGTPNIYVADPLAAFAEYEGELVRLSATNEAYSVQLAEPGDAEAFWAEHRPSVAVDHPPDPDFVELVPLLSIPTGTAEERGAAVSRFGGKVSGLATLYKTLPAQYQAQGFGVPTARYLEFMAKSGWQPEGQAQTISFADTIELWLSDPEFRSDAELRAARLKALGAAIVAEGVVDEALLKAIGDQVADVFGGPAVMIRLRSSSNVEDGLDFNGAGLYTSVSACALDEAGAPASACDADKGPRPVDVALKTVWASLWGPGAFEEREFYQIDHRAAAMGVLASTRYEDERANGVIFTGNPADPGDKRYTVNVQLGEVDVVSPPPGVTAELDRLTIEGHAVTAIERAAASSLAPPGTYVLSDEQLEELGAVVSEFTEGFPVELGEHAASEVLFDLEFKITAAGELAIKQIRPFLRNPSSSLMPPPCG